MALKTLDDLTPKIRAKIDDYKDWCVKDLYSGVEYENYNEDMLVKYIEKVYELAGFKKPVIVVAKDPIEYKEKYNQLLDENVMIKVNDFYQKKNGAKNDATLQEVYDAMKIAPKRDEQAKSHFLFLCSSYHRVYLMWYKFIQDEFNIDHSNKETLNWLFDHARNNISRCYFTELYVLVLRMPKYIRRNDVGFHCVDAPAIEWENYGIHYVNGRKIDSDIFNAVSEKKMTLEEFMAIDDEDTKANIVTLITEKFGNEELMKFLNAEIADEKTIQHTSGHEEIVKIWKTKETFEFLSDINGNSNQPYAWLELKCPSTGSVYLISTSPHFTDAIEACKFHRPQSIPSELRYDFTTFNN